MGAIDPQEQLGCPVGKCLDDRIYVCSVLCSVVPYEIVGDVSQGGCPHPALSLTLE